MAQVSYGTITITDTNDISRIYMEYCRSTKNQLSGDTVPNITRAWDVKTPPWVDGEYIWQRAVVEKSGTLEKTYGTPVCISGEKGETGQQGPQGGTGAAGRSLDSTETKYAQVAANSTEAQVKALAESRWTLNVPSYNSSLPEYWVRVTNVYSNPTETQKIYYKDNGITDAVKTSADANATASAANTTAGEAKTQAAAAEGKADSAVSTANSANTNATNALNIATGINQHFWTISTDYATGVPAGSYITDTAIDTFKSNKTGGNLLTRSDGIWIRNGINTLTSLTGTALTFYNPTNNEAQLVIGANGTLQSGNYDRGDNDTFSAFGTKIDLTQGEIYSPYFRLSQGEQGKAPGAYISGQIEALSGNIGGSEDGNYWDIGDFVNFNNVSIGSLIGHGNSMIQLGQSSVWRLSNNRIHSGWYLEDDKYLHFPSFSGTNEYYDYGIHVPESTSQSFIYLRTANTTNNLSSLLTHLNDDIGTTQTPWTYKFYVDGNGNVHAPGFYIGDSTTPIGGGTGTVAERLTQGYGSSNQPVYFNSNGVPTNTTYQLNAAGAKGVDTSISAASTSMNLPTSQAVAAFVEGKGYSTTDNKVQTSQANTTKIYLVGTSTAGTSTGTLNFDSNIYLTTEAGTLHATKFEGTATQATSDSDGNKISTTYLKLSGGNVTGAVSFGSSVSIDELTVGDLVVNGAASFTNNLQANTINGVAVGSNPKFTDTVTTVTVTGSGNAITSASASGGAVTLTKGTTFPTGSGMNGYLTKWTGANTIGNGPALGSDATKFLNNKGEWAVPAGTYTYTLPLAANGTRGGVQIGYTTSGKNYAVQLSNEKMYVNVPWENTTYESKAAASGGTDVSLVTTGEKYTWNQKTSNTGTVTSIATSSPITGGTITSSGTIGHATSGVGNAVTTAGLYKFKYDTYGHVTGVTAVAKADITGLGIPAQDTTYSNASTTTAGLMSAADKKKLDNIQVDSSGQAVAANVAGRWGIDVTFSDANVAQVGHSNSAITASNTQAAKTTSSVTSTQLAFGDVINFPYIAYDTYGHITSKTNLYFKMPAAPSSTGSATNDSDGNPINTTYIKKSIGTAAGDIIYWSAASTPTRLAKGSNGQVLKLANGVPTWGTDNNDNTTYSLSGSLSSHKFTTTLTPSSGSATTSAFTLAAGSNISLTDSGTTITIAATDTNTATAVDNILDGSNSGTAITYAPYTARADKLMFYTGTTAPNGTTRLNLNGYLYATKLYSGGSEVLTSHQDISGKIDTAGTGLSKSGTTLNHSNSITAQTTQAVYPIKIDAQGHISAYGSAQTILSLGTGSSNAYRGDYGNTAYTHATDSGRLTTAKTSAFYKFSVTSHGHVGSVTAVAASDITGLLTFNTTYNASTNKIATMTDISNAISGASNTYVTIATDQTITASQKTFTGATRWGSASKYGAVHYDTSLEALVFSFA